MSFDLIIAIIATLCSIIGVFFTLFYGYWYLYSIVTVFFKPKKTPQAKTQHKYGYIICARNEEAVIAELVNSIYSQNYPRENMQVFVMADNCTDNTANAAREAGAIVYERFNKEKVGKGYAMQTLLDYMLKDGIVEKFKGFFVFDADNLLDKDYTLKMNDVIDNGARIAMGLRNTKNWNENWISACNGLYFIRDSYQMNRARLILNAESLVTGTGWYMDKDIILKEGGWNYTLMSEDTQFSIAQILKGEHIVSCADAVFYDEQVTTWSQSWKQRLRWINGTKQVWKTYGVSIFKNIFSKRFLTFWDCFSLTFGGSYFSALGMLSCIISMIVTMIAMLPNPAALIVPFSFLLSLYFNFFLSTTVSLFFALDKIHLPLGKKIRYIFLFPLFMMTYMAVGFAVVILRKDIKWEPIIHRSTASFAKSNKKQK